MSLDDNARRLAEHLQDILSEADTADRDNAELSEKLSLQEIRVLRTVGSSPCCIMSGIAKAIRLSLSSATGLIDRLCEKKLVKRDRSAEDRRVVQVELTDEGRELHRTAVETRAAFARRLLGALDADEQKDLLSLLGKISAGIQEDKAKA